MHKKCRFLFDPLVKIFKTICIMQLVSETNIFYYSIEKCIFLFFYSYQCAVYIENRIYREELKESLCMNFFQFLFSLKGSSKCTNHVNVHKLYAVECINTVCSIYFNFEFLRLLNKLHKMNYVNKKHHLIYSYKEIHRL